MALSASLVMVSSWTALLFIRIASSQEKPIFGKLVFERNLWHESLARQDKTLATQAALVQTRIRLDGYNANITKGTMDQGYNSFKKIG